MARTIWAQYRYQGVRMRRTLYRGQRIFQTTAGDYWSPAFGSHLPAASLATMRRWIDCAIAAREIKERDSRS